jgi:hypothetical protein
LCVPFRVTNCGQHAGVVCLTYASMLAGFRGMCAQTYMYVLAYTPLIKSCCTFVVGQAGYLSGDGEGETPSTRTPKPATPPRRGAATSGPHSATKSSRGVAVGGGDVGTVRAASNNTAGAGVASASPVGGAGSKRDGHAAPRVPSPARVSGCAGSAILLELSLKQHFSVMCFGCCYAYPVGGGCRAGVHHCPSAPQCACPWSHCHWPWGQQRARGSSHCSTRGEGPAPA